jgi:hypothetical protein
MADDTTEQEAPETTDESTDDGPDLREQMADLSGQFKNFVESQAPPEPQAQPLDVLSGDDDDDDDGFEPEYEPAYDPYVAQQPPTDPRTEQLWEWATDREQERIRDGLQGLDTKYDDFKEKVPEIRQVLTDMGITDPAQRGNAVLVERVYLSLKAEAAASAETPAEEAASRGAGIERGASGSAPSDEDPDQAFIEAFGKNRNTSVFG